MLGHGTSFERTLQRYRQGEISRRRFVQAASAIGLSAPLATLLAERPELAAAQGTPSARTPSGELVVSMTRSVISLDPQGPQSAELPTSVVASHIFDTLIGRDPVSGDLVPRLAVSWEPTDETTWTFKLREGVTFHDGSPFTSEDVKASLERVIELAGPLAPIWAGVNAVEAPDPLTVVVRTEQAMATVPVSATLLWIAPAAQLRNEGFFNQPVGLGPFTFVSWQPDAEVRLAANPNYWGGAPGVETLVFRDIPEVATRLTALETGEIDLTYGVPADQLPALQENPDLTHVAIPIYSIYFNWFNAQREPFTDVRVRRAMCHALDLDTMVNDLLQGVAVRAQAPVASTVFGFAPQEPYAYDPELARSLLAEAGYPDGFQTTLQWSPGGPQQRELVQTMISYWAEIGVTVESLEKERAQWLEDLLALNWDMNFQTNSVRTGDADFGLRRLYTSAANRTGYSNPELDEVLAQAAAVSDPAARQELYAEACRIIWEEAVGIFPFELIDNYVYQNRVQGVVPAPSEVPTFEAVTVTE